MGNGAAADLISINGRREFCNVAAILDVKAMHYEALLKNSYLIHNILNI